MAPAQLRRDCQQQLSWRAFCASVQATAAAFEAHPKAVAAWKLLLQVSNEVKAARSFPDCSCLGHQVAWREADDGSMVSASLHAGRTIEALLQEPAAGGGWADLQLWQRVEVARDVLAGGVHALMRMRPWVSVFLV